VVSAKVEVRITDVPAFREFVERVQNFIQEYAWHTRDCAAIDADGEWHLATSPPCTCGYDEALAALVPPEPT
jgi:hypothetical protein